MVSLGFGYVFAEHHRLDYSLADLPFVDAVYKEVLRWSPVAPFSLPHSSLAADEINGKISKIRDLVTHLLNAFNARLRDPGGHNYCPEHMVKLISSPCERSGPEQ